MIKRYNISWDLPNNISFFISLNEEGFSKGKYKYANFSYNVGDDHDCVTQNIEILKKENKINNISFMNQTHSEKIKEITIYENMINSDAIYTHNHDIACAVITADCIPILITNISGTLVGCIHAGWRGLKSGILQNVFDNIQEDKSKIKILIGPCISNERYEVGYDIVELFPEHIKFFSKNKSGRYNMNLRQIAYNILSQLGITDVTISPVCTYDDKRFYSYRRSNLTGRFVSLIWFNK